MVKVKNYNIEHWNSDVDPDPGSKIMGNSCKNRQKSPAYDIFENRNNTFV